MVIFGNFQMIMPIPPKVKFGNPSVKSFINHIFSAVNALSPEQNGCHFAANVSNMHFLERKVCVFVPIWLKFIP